MQQQARRALTGIWVVFFAAGLATASQAPAEVPLEFERERIGDVTYETATAFDVNNNGAMDIVSVEYWFEGPDFTEAHRIAEVDAIEDYYDAYTNFPMDVNGNGYKDIITGGWWNGKVKWRENPQGEPGLWETHTIDAPGEVMHILFHDIDGDGHCEILPNTPFRRQRVYKLVRDENGKGTGEFEKHIISPRPTGHGLGVGDINGNGRKDIVTHRGWFEAPADPMNEEWAWNAEFELQSASIPILVHDVSGNGMNDLIVGEAHEYGLYWKEQQRDEEGERRWVKHMIEPDRSQYHTLALADLDGDGELELITGKRYWAHQGRDPGAEDPVGVYYYKMEEGAFTEAVIDYGEPSEASGVGIHFWVDDVTGNGWNDILAPGKEGLFLFRNQGFPAASSEPE